MSNRVIDYVNEPLSFNGINSQTDVGPTNTDNTGIIYALYFANNAGTETTVVVAWTNFSMTLPVPANDVTVFGCHFPIRYKGQLKVTPAAAVDLAAFLEE